jgi:hypothetical protein
MCGGYAQVAGNHAADKRQSIESNFHFRTLLVSPNCFFRPLMDLLKVCPLSLLQPFLLGVFFD